MSKSFFFFFGFSSVIKGPLRNPILGDILIALLYQEIYLIDIDVFSFLLRFPNSKYPLIIKIGHRVYFFGEGGVS